MMLPIEVEWNEASQEEVPADNVSVEILQQQRKKLIRKISKLQRALKNVEVRLSRGSKEVAS